MPQKKHKNKPKHPVAKLTKLNPVSQPSVNSTASMHKQMNSNAKRSDVENAWRGAGIGLGVGCAAFLAKYLTAAGSTAKDVVMARQFLWDSWFMTIPTYPSITRQFILRGLDAAHQIVEDDNAAIASREWSDVKPWLPLIILAGMAIGYGYNRFFTPAATQEQKPQAENKALDAKSDQPAMTNRS